MFNYLIIYLFICFIVLLKVQVAAKKDSIAQRQQAIEFDRQRTQRNQAEVERRVAIKQQELTDREGKINQEVARLRKIDRCWSKGFNKHEMTKKRPKLKRKLKENFTNVETWKCRSVKTIKQLKQLK